MSSTTAASWWWWSLISPKRPADSSTNIGRKRLPPLLMIYSAIWLTSATSECRDCRITLSTLRISSAMHELIMLGVTLINLINKKIFYHSLF